MHPSHFPVFWWPTQRLSYSDMASQQSPQRLLLKDWLIDKLDSNAYGRSRWVDREKMLFCVPWMHQSHRDFDEEDYRIFLVCFPDIFVILTVYPLKYECGVVVICFVLCLYLIPETTIVVSANTCSGQMIFTIHLPWLFLLGCSVVGLHALIIHIFYCVACVSWAVLFIHAWAPLHLHAKFF